MTEYRVQEYVRDGAFYKSYIFHISPQQYHELNKSENRRLIILPPEDPYGEALPARVLTQAKLNELVQHYETLELKRLRAADNMKGEQQHGKA